MGDWNFACPDWKVRLSEGRSLIPDLPLDEKMAARAVAIFNKLRLPDVAGQPELRLAAGDWQREIPATVFGSLMPNGRRMVRKVFQLVPKKNNKTTGLGATMVTALLVDDAPRQPYFLYGPSQEIAQGAFDQAAGMIFADPTLRSRFQIKAHVKTILDLVTESTLKIQTFDEGVATGVKPKGVGVDEVHILGKRHYAERVMGQLWGGMISRPDSFLIEITTQSDEQPAGLFLAELQMARGIRDGRITGEAANTLPILYEFPEEFQTNPEQPWRDPANWHVVLPNLGRSVHIDLLRETYAEAVEKDEGELRRWASQHLNIEIGIGLHSKRWLGADYWEAAVFEPLRDIDELLRRAEVVVAGIDGGGLDDLLGLCILGRDRETGVWLYWFKAWAHRKVLEIRKVIAPALLGFEQDGDLVFWGDPKNPVRVAERLSTSDRDDDFGTVLPEEIDADIGAIVAVLKRVRDAGLFPETGGIGIDPAAIGALLDVLADAGFTLTTEHGPGLVTLVSQSVVSMFSAINTLQRRLEAGTAAHGGSKMMAWCVGNAKAVQKGNAVAITKDVAGRSKIDPLVAGFIATKLMERNPVAGDGEGPSVYEERGLLVLG